MNENSYFDIDLELQNLLSYSTKDLSIGERIYKKIKDIKFFAQFFEDFSKKFDYSFILKLCNSLQLETIEKGKIVFAQNDLSNNKLYVILSGYVGILKSENLDQVIAEREEFSGFSPIRRSTRTFTTNVTIEENIQDDEIIDINEKYRELYENLLNNNKSVSKLEKSSMRSMILSFHLSRMLKNPLHIQSNQIISTITIESYIEKYGTLLRVMETGEAVGEKALMEGKPRTATMFTITKCWFLILQKEDLKTVRNQFSKIAKERSDFLRNVFGLKPNAFTSKVEENMLYSFTSEKYEKDHVLTKQGSYDAKVFIVEEGELLIEKMIILGESIKGRDDFKTNHIIPIKICKAGKGTIIGDEILFYDKLIYNYNTKVISKEVSLLVINKHYFDVKFPSEIKLGLYKNYKIKEKQREKHILQRLEDKKNIFNQYSQLFYNKNVNVYKLLQKSCFESFNNNLKRTNNDFEKDESFKKPIVYDYFVGPRAKYRFIRNKLSYKFEKARKKAENSQTNESIIDLEKVMSYSENFLKKNYSSSSSKILKLDFGEQSEVRFKQKTLEKFDYLKDKEKYSNETAQISFLKDKLTTQKEFKKKYEDSLQKLKTFDTKTLYSQCFYYKDKEVNGHLKVGRISKTEKSIFLPQIECLTIQNNEGKVIHKENEENLTFSMRLLKKSLKQRTLKLIPKNLI